MSDKTYRWLLGILILLHFGILLLYASEMIPQDFKHPDYRYRFHHGGDEDGYYLQIIGLTTGEFVPTKYPMGFAILSLPFAYLFPHESAQDLIEPIALFWSVVMFPIGQLMLAWLVNRISQYKRLAIGAVFIWTMLPLVVWLPLYVLWNSVVAETYSVHLIWAQMLSDGPAAFFTILAFVIYWLARERQFPVWWMVLLGAVLGFLVMIRLTSALTPLAIAFLLLIERQSKSLLVVSISAVIFASPQFIYNQVFFDSFLSTGYTVLDVLPKQGLFHPSYLTDVLSRGWDVFGILVLIGIGLGIIFMGIGLRGIWRQHRIAGLMIASWIVPYLALYSVYYYSWVGGLTRFLIPMYPALAIAIAYGIWQLVQWFQHIRLQKNIEPSM